MGRATGDEEDRSKSNGKNKRRLKLLKLWLRRLKWTLMIGCLCSQAKNLKIMKGKSKSKKKKKRRSKELLKKKL